MTQNKQPNKHEFIADMSKSLGTLMGSLNDMKQDWEQGFRKRLEQYLLSLQLVGREEYETTKALVAKLHKENAALAKRLEALEGKKAPKSGKGE